MSSSQPPSPRLALIPISDTRTAPEWRPIFEASNQVVLYNPASHALTVTSTSSSILASPNPPGPVVVPHTAKDVVQCPYCHKPLSDDTADVPYPRDHFERHDEQSSRVANYFHLLAAVNESSRPASPYPNARQTPKEGEPLGRANMAQGYFTAFFREVKRLGMGANGTVLLCEHVLDGNSLGRYAVKKVAVGQSHDYLLNTLREVRLLETLRHPNIITYHHAWLESSRFSTFADPIPTLFILMQWAEGGSLDDFIALRQGRKSVPHNADNASSPSSEEIQSRSARIRAFRAQQQHQAEAPDKPREPKRETKAVHLLSGEELRGLFGDIVTGLSFLHDRGILHLDLKPGNVLLTLDEGQLIPRAMLSDFGTSQDMLHTARTRSGNTGTLEYTAPEALNALRSVDSKTDMWSLGMILYKLLFFRLPYTHDDFAELEKEVLHYPGFKADNDIPTGHQP
ncbi:putative serine/threonine-protein kinase iks1 [Tulasnella sp. 403]|nr:putative serine/threonine-protein kinase iks1 [Tulasnella sp. 403]